MTRAQSTLFSAEMWAPQGLDYQPQFVSADEEARLIEYIEALPLTPFQFGAFEGRRRVASFGWRYDYATQKLETADPLPDWISPYSARIESLARLSLGSIRQVLCTEYDKGVGIGWHRDKAHFDSIFGLSLGSTCNFRFRRRKGEKWERFTLEAQPRSLYMMSGESRNLWEHSISPVKETRYSITFRTMAKKKDW
jgi:alkylated DNA repair dioxygenase AlkB